MRSDSSQPKRVLNRTHFISIRPSAQKNSAADLGVSAEGGSRTLTSLRTLDFEPRLEAFGLDCIRVETASKFFHGNVFGLATHFSRILLTWGQHGQFCPRFVPGFASVSLHAKAGHAVEV